MTSFRLCGRLIVILSDEETIREAALTNRMLIGRHTMLTNHLLAKGYGIIFPRSLLIYLITKEQYVHFSETKLLKVQKRVSIFCPLIRSTFHENALLKLGQPNVSV